MSLELRRPFTTDIRWVITAAGAALLLAVCAGNINAGGAILPGGIGIASGQDTCVDDVRVGDIYIYETFSSSFKDPPNYVGGDDVSVGYEVHNDSCNEKVNISVELTGSTSGALIKDDDPNNNPCPHNCDIEPGEALYGVIKWRLSEHPPAENEAVVVKVTINSADFTDSDLSNNTKTSEDFINVVSDEPAAPEVDVALTSVTPSHTNAPIGTSIVFTAVITNNGSQAVAPSLALSIDDGDTAAAEPTPVTSTNVDAIEPGESSSVALTWDTTGAEAGIIALRARLTAVDDASADDNELSASITLRDAIVDVRLESIDPAAITAPAGESVGLTVTASNRGDFAAVPMVEVYIDDELAPVVSVPMASIVPGDEGTVELTWDTTAMAAGDYQLKVSVRLYAATAEPTAVRSIEAVLYYPVDVAVTSAVVANPPTITGASVTVRATVENLSENDAAQVAVAMTIRGETEPLATGIIAPLPAGNSAVLDLVWDTTGRVVAQYDPRVAATTKWDTDGSNDRQSVNIMLRNWATMTEATPRNATGVIGDTIQLSAHVLNHGPSALENLTVGLYDSGDTALATTAISSIAARATEIATLNWDTSEQEVGVHELYASVNSPGIGSDVDDTTLVTVTLHNEIALTGVRQSPDDAVVGQPVAVVAELVNQSDHTVALATVQLLGEESDGGMKTYNEIAATDLASGASQQVSLGWDSSGSTAGTHQFRVKVVMPERGGDPNDERAITVSLRDPVVDVALTGATSSHSIAVIGQSITIAATVVNNGEAPLSVPVSLFVDPPTEPGTTPTPQDVSNTPVIQPGGSETVDLIWDTAGLNPNKIGEYPLLLVAEVPGDVSDDNNEITLDAELFRSAFDADHPTSECVDDVGVELKGIYDHVDVMRLNTPPIYSREDTLFITYRIFNYSCDKDITAGLTLTGSISETAINDRIDPCLSGCFIPASGMTKRFVRWQLLDYPVVIGEMIEATVSVVSPAGFTESDATNNTLSSSETITVGDLSDVHVQIGKNDARRGRVAGALLLSAFDLDYPATTPADHGAQVAGFAVVPDDLVIGSSAIIYAYVLNRGNVETTIPVALHVDDGATPIYAAQTETLGPGEFQRLELLWRIPADLALGSHKLTVSVSDPNLAAATGARRSKTVVVRQPELKVNIVDVSAPVEALVGDNITVNVVVQNTGQTSLKVQAELFVDSGNAPVHKVTTEAMEPSETRTATLVWDSPVGAPAREYLLRVRAGGSEQTRTVTLRQPTAALSLTNLEASPSVVIFGKDDKVTVSAALRNTGETAIVASVALYLGDISAPVSTSGGIAMNPRETSKVELEWHLPVNIEFGDFLLRMVAEVTKPINSVNDSATATVTVRTPYTDAELIRLIAEPSSAYVGEPVSVEVTVFNPSNSRTSIPITLDFPGNSRQDEHRKPVVDPHQSVTRQIEWRTGDLAPGTYTFRASAEIAGRTITADKTIKLQVDTEILSITSNPADTAMRGQPVTILVQVRNNGRAAINVPVELNFPPEAKAPERRSPRVSAGGQATAAFVWSTGNYPVGVHTLRAELVSAGNHTAGKTTADVQVELTAVPLAATITKVQSTPDAPMVGTPVEIMVAVRNDGPVAVNVPVTLYFPSAGKLPETRRPRIGPGETGLATFEWLTGNYRPGTHSFRVMIGSDESTERVFELTLALPPMDAEILSITSNPADTVMQGQPVEILVAVRNNGRAPINIPVQLIFPSTKKSPELRSPRVLPDATETVRFTWRTGDYSVGEHTLRARLIGVVNVTEGNTTDAVRVELTAAPLDAEILSITSNPADTAVQGLPVEILVAVRNNGPVAVYVPIELTFPSPDKAPEPRSSRVLPGATETVRFTWRTGDYSVGEHTLWATLAAAGNVTAGKTAAAVRVELTAAPLDAEILSIASNPADTAVQGLPVEILVQVRNNGPVAVYVPIGLTFPSPDKAPEPRSPRVLPGATETVRFTWRTGDYSVGEHTLRARLIGVGNVTEGNTSADVRVELTAAPLDAEIISIASNPADTAVQGQPVTILVQVRNNGRAAINVPVELNFPSADKVPEPRSPRVLPDATETVRFTWRTGDYSVGEHTLRARLIGVGNVAEGSTSAAVRVELTAAPLDAEILSIASNPADTAVQGQPVEILVQVRNNGPVAVYVPIELTFPSPDKAPEPRSPRVLPGEMETVRFTWRTGDYSVGEHTLWATLAAVDNVTAGKTAAAAVRVELTLAPLEAKITRVWSTPDAPMVGTPVEIMVDVRNDGPVAVNVPVTLYFPSAGKLPETRRPRIGPGETAEAAFRWLTSRYHPGTHSFRVTIGNAESIERVFELKLALPKDVRVELMAVPLEATITKVQSTPDAPMVGTPVEIMVAVRNDGPVAVNVPVTLHYPSADKQPETRRPRIGPGETAEVAFRWLTSRYHPGTHSFRIVIADERTNEHPIESEVFEVTLLPPRVDFVVQTIAIPDIGRPYVQGEWIPVVALVRNLGPSRGRGTLTLQDLTYQADLYDRSVTLQPDESRWVEFTWKSLRYQTGEHQLRVKVDTDYDLVSDNDRSEAATVEILSNRDIIVGFGDNHPAAIILAESKQPNIQSTVRPLERIVGLDNAASNDFTLAAPPFGASVSATDQANGGMDFGNDFAGIIAMYQLRQAAVVSAHHCAELQRLLSNSQPRVVLCPGAPPLLQ